MMKFEELKEKNKLEVELLIKEDEKFQKES